MNESDCHEPVCRTALVTLGLLNTQYMSRVMCPVTCFKVVKLVGRGSVINGATSSSFHKWLISCSILF